jgi:hypothetical protein
VNSQARSIGKKARRGLAEDNRTLPEKGCLQATSRPASLSIREASSKADFIDIILYGITTVFQCMKRQHALTPYLTFIELQSTLTSIMPVDVATAATLATSPDSATSIRTYGKPSANGKFKAPNWLKSLLLGLSVVFGLMQRLRDDTYVKICSLFKTSTLSDGLLTETSPASDPSCLVPRVPDKMARAAVSAALHNAASDDGDLDAEQASQNPGREEHSTDTDGKSSGTAVNPRKLSRVSA